MVARQLFGQFVLLDELMVTLPLERVAQDLPGVLDGSEAVGGLGLLRLGDLVGVALQDQLSVPLLDDFSRGIVGQVEGLVWIRR